MISTALINYDRTIRDVDSVQIYGLDGILGTPGKEHRIYTVERHQPAKAIGVSTIWVTAG